MVFINPALVAAALAATILPSQVSSSLAGNSVGSKRISIQQLQSSAPTSPDHSEINLHRLLHESHGILRLSLGADDEQHDYSKLRKRALSSLCDCRTFHGGSAFEEALESHPKDLQQIDLPDGAVRRTLASATVGFDDGVDGSSKHASVLEIPSWVEESCGKAAYESFEDLRDAVADVVNVFMEKLDTEKNDKGKMEQSYRQILSSANHLEHFHAYTKSNNSEKDQVGGDFMSSENLEKDVSTLDYHVDAGFFLAFAPAMNCHTYTTDNDSFYLKGFNEPLSFEEDEVVIMMGAGAQYWLPSHDDQSPFLAASHALRLSQNTHRSWYGKMHLLPSSFEASNVAPQLSSSPAPMKYGNVLPNFELKENKAHVPTAPVDGCGTAAFNENSLPFTALDTSTVQKQSRRRLQHVNSPANCNNQTDFFCWHQCIDIPSAEHAEAYVNDGYSLYCLDPSILVSSDSIAQATEPCRGGFAHNSACKGTWHETDETIPGYKLPYEVKKKEENVFEHNHTQHQHTATYPNPALEEQYCYGGTSMYMEGFTWQGSTCVIYLFQSWILTTPGKFALAALGSILFGIALEFVLWKRRNVYAMPPGKQRLCLSALVYGIQLSMGYFIMLVIMTYSGPLFLSTVGGMMLGHIFFNAQDSLAKQYTTKKRESEEVAAIVAGETTCGMERRASGSASNTELGSYQHSNGGAFIDSSKVNPLDASEACESTKLREGMADGATPCCQYTV